MWTTIGGTFRCNICCDVEIIIVWPTSLHLQMYTLQTYMPDKVHVRSISDCCYAIQLYVVQNFMH